MGSSSNEQVTAAAAVVSPGITEKKKVDWDASEVERVHSQDDMQKDHQDYSRMDVSARKRLQCPTIMIPVVTERLYTERGGQICIRNSHRHQPGGESPSEDAHR